MDELKIRLTQPSLIELGLGLSLAKTLLDHFQTTYEADFQYIAHVDGGPFAPVFWGGQMTYKVNWL